MEIKPGSIFGRWTLVEALGEGGNGNVWLTREGEQEGAIKFLQERHYESDVRYRRFRDEVRIQGECAPIRGVLPLLDSHLPEGPSRNDQPWLVSTKAILIREYLRSHSSVREAVTACASIAVTLSELHERDICHRDIKPANLFYYHGGFAIGDFGLAHYPEKESITDPEERLGPTFFIAPEMLTSPNTADPKPADVFSFAKTMWCLVTGESYPPQGELQIGRAPLGKWVTYPRLNILDGVLTQCTLDVPTLRPSITRVANELTHWLNERPAPIALEGAAKKFAAFSPIAAESEAKEKRLADQLRHWQQVVNGFAKEIGQQIANTTGLAIEPARNTWGYLHPLLQQTQTPDVRRGFSDLLEVQSPSAQLGVSFLLWWGFFIEASLSGEGSMRFYYAISLRGLPQGKTCQLYEDACSFRSDDFAELTALQALQDRAVAALEPVLNKFLEALHRGSEAVANMPACWMTR